MSSEFELNLLKKYCKGKGLNIGCGPRPIESAINVDISPSAKADVYAPAEMLPFYSGTMDYIVSSHCLEHIHEAPLIILREWLRVLKVGGVLAFLVPDGMCGTHALGESPGQFVEGKHVHHFTTVNLFELMDYAGFVDVHTKQIDRPEWKNGTIFVTGVKNKETRGEIPGDSFRAYLLWLGAVGKTVTLHGLLKWMRHRW